MRNNLFVIQNWNRRPAAASNFRSLNKIGTRYFNPRCCRISYRFTQSSKIEKGIREKATLAKHDLVSKKTSHTNDLIRIVEFPVSKRRANQVPSQGDVTWNDEHIGKHDSNESQRKHADTMYLADNEFVIYQSSRLHREIIDDSTNNQNKLSLSSYTSSSSSPSSSLSWIIASKFTIEGNGHQPEKGTNIYDLKRSSFRKSNLYEKFIVPLFFPANYPQSVSTGYSRYAFFSFLASIAGSANMVLSTQTLLLAMMTAAPIINDGGQSGASNVNRELFEVDGVGSQASEIAAARSTIEEGLDSTLHNVHDSQEKASKAIGKSTSSVTTASVMAGALNWVVKDGVGQFGGVWYASYVNQNSQLDKNPKYYRMISSIALDVAALIEIMTPLLGTALVPSIWLLPIACISTILKNIAYITASAARAAIHQTLITTATPSIQKTSNAVESSQHVDTTTFAEKTHNTNSKQPMNTLLRAGNNLADITAKAGSQTMVGSLIGTSLGIAISSIVLQEDLQYFIGAFVLLSASHQFCTYQSLKYVALRHLNYERLMIVLEHFVKQNIQKISEQNALQDATMALLSPEQVAKMESFISLPSSRFNFEFNLKSTPIVVGGKLSNVCPNGYHEFDVLRTLLHVDNDNDADSNKDCSKKKNEAYIINVASIRNDDSTKAMSSHLKHHEKNRHQKVCSHCTINLLFFEHATNYHVVKGMLHATMLQNQLLRTDSQPEYGSNDVDYHRVISKAYEMTNKLLPEIWIGLNHVGWDLDNELFDVEPPGARRIAIL